MELGGDISYARSLGALRAPTSSGLLTLSFTPLGRSGRVTHADVSMMHVKNGAERTDGKLNSRSRMLTASDIYVNSPILVIIVITMTTTVAIIITNLSVQKLRNASDNGNRIDQCLLFQS